MATSPDGFRHYFYFWVNGFFNLFFHVFCFVLLNWRRLTQTDFREQPVKNDLFYKKLFKQ